MYKLNYFIALVLILFYISTSAQNYTELDQKFTAMLLEGDEVGWAKLVHSLQGEELNAHDSETLLLAEYGLIGFYIANEYYQKAEVEITKFESHLAVINSIIPLNAEHLTLDAAIEGFKIVIDPKKVVFLAAQNKNKISKALEINPNSPITIFEQANAFFFRPVKYGGDQEKAIQLYEKAFLLLQNEEQHNWVYYNVGAWLGQVYIEIDKLGKARNICEVLLADAPEYLFVKDILYPNIKQSEFDKKWEAFLEEAGED